MTFRVRYSEPNPMKGPVVTTKFSNTDRYPVPPDQIMAMLQDPEYSPAKYSALGDISYEVTTHEVADGGVSTVVEREVPSSMPDLAKKILGQTNHMVQKENWRAAADGYAADMTIESPGKPLAITGDMTVVPVGDGESDWTVNFEVKASIPLVGGKIEKMVEKETMDTLPKEFAFNKEWLASH